MMKQISILLFFVIAINLTHFVAQAQSDCKILNWHEYEQSSDAGEVVFVADDMIWFGDIANEQYTYMPDYFAPASISPDGTRLAWVNTFWGESEIERSELHLLEMEKDRYRVLEILADPFSAPYKLHWIDNHDLLTVYSTVQHRIPSYFPLSIIDWNTLDVTYIPLYISDIARRLEDQGHSIQELLTYGYDDRWNRPPNISPNGHLVLDSDRYTQIPFIFDTQTQEVRTLENLYGEKGYPNSIVIWSANSTQLLYTQNHDDNEALYDLIIYNIDSNDLQNVFTFDAGQVRSATIIANSWSPDKRYIVVPISDERNYIKQLHIFDLETQELKRTCFDLPTRFEYGIDFAWSLDGRYLALNGIVNPEPNTEPATIYTYDTQTDIAYEVFTGDAEIIGWAKLGDG